jgi:hypothetical protein
MRPASTILALMIGVLMVGASASTAAAAEAEDPVWRDAAAWRAFYWPQLQRSALWRQSDEAPSTPRGPVRVRNALTVAGLPFSLRIANLPANPRQPAILLVARPGAEDVCRAGGRWLAEVFGRPTRTARIVHGYGDFQSANALEQWAVGRTMITSECASLGEGVSESLLVRFEGVALARIVAEPVRLTCAFEGRKPFELLLDDYYGKLLRTDYTEIPGQLEAGQATMELPGDDGDRGTITIDRRTGALRSVFDDGSGEARGACKGDGGRAF